jgi:NADPH-dependent 2,4-dienoyl-CoA reductase/sulfur reductase-like enzyme
MKQFLLTIILWSFLTEMSCAQTQQPVEKVDICVYGGTSAGVIAAYTARKLGKSVVLIEPDRHLGGLTTGGLGKRRVSGFRSGCTS